MSVQNNPFSLLFGKPPLEMIERVAQADAIYSDFCSEWPASQINLISGIRGSGKTVFLTETANRFKQTESWVVVDLNPDRDLLKSLVAKLYSEKSLMPVFKKAKINLSFFGIGVEIEGAAPVSDIEVALGRMLESLKRDGKRLLVTIDEVTNNKAMRIFVSAFQILIRQDLPIFLLMTGLYKNIVSIRNADTLTFLERAPRTELEPLNQNLMAQRYADSLHVTLAEATRLAGFTKGYSFAFQVLGYYAWENPGETDQAMARSAQYLFEFSYKKIWSELSKTDKKVLRAIAQVPGGEIALIREKLEYTSSQFNPYRDRLIKAGVVTSPGFGLVEFALPAFELFVKQYA